MRLSFLVKRDYVTFG